MNVIRLQAVSKTFRAPKRGAEIKALDAVTLHISAGEFVAVVGPSGSGKSTLLHAIGGLSRPSAGEVHVDGTRVDHLSSSARAALRLRKIGFVFQTFNLIPYLTCLENIALPSRLAGANTRVARRSALELLDRLGLSARTHHLPGQLSVGERQRVGIGRALVNAPKVLLADEPTGNLDPATGEQVMVILEDLNRQGQTIVMVTHDPRLANRAGRTLRLCAGEVEGLGRSDTAVLAS